jgi:hypothetical protein
MEMALGTTERSVKRTAEVCGFIIVTLAQGGPRHWGRGSFGWHALQLPLFRKSKVGRLRTRLAVLAQGGLAHGEWPLSAMTKSFDVRCKAANRANTAQIRLLLMIGRVEVYAQGLQSLVFIEFCNYSRDRDLLAARVVWKGFLPTCVLPP